MNALKRILSIFAILFSVMDSLAQQDPQYSQYMFNQLAINPAYAGSKEALSTSAFIRSQWTGIEGAPSTETLTLHGPLKKKKVGLGLAIIADQIGPKNSIGAMGSYAYRIPVGNGKLSFGLRAGIYSFTYDWDAIKYKDQSDPVAQSNPTQIVPTADAGIYYYTNTLYVGFSATHLYNGKLTSVSNSNGDDAQFSPHYFFTFGKAWALSDKLIFNPSVMVKAAENSPGTADLNMSFLINQKIWLGVSGRSSGSVVAYTQFNITDKFRLGYAFDFGLNRIGRAGGGTHEIMLGYDFNIYRSKMASPRYL